MIRVDAQLSSHLALWLHRRFGVGAFSLEYLGLDEAEDKTVSAAARKADVIVMTKDEDSVRLQKGVVAYTGMY